MDIPDDLSVAEVAAFVAEGPAVRAECHSDDHVQEVTFDASRWFAQADDEAILALAHCGWGGDYPADDVATFMASHDDGVKAMFAYLELVTHIKDAPGFECHVDAAQAQAWLDQRRPALASAVREQEGD